MKTDKSKTQLWTVLAIGNILAIIYPIRLLLRADSPDEHLFAAVALVGSLFLLAVADAVSVVVAVALGSSKP